MDKKPKRTNRIQTASFYLGKEERQRRLKALDVLASQLGISNRSVLIQKIADGEITLEVSPSPDPA